MFLNNFSHGCKVALFLEENVGFIDHEAPQLGQVDSLLASATLEGVVKLTKGSYYNVTAIRLTRCCVVGHLDVSELTDLRIDLCDL